jgi:hypothetical protein
VSQSALNAAQQSDIKSIEVTLRILDDDAGSSEQRHDLGRGHRGTPGDRDGIETLRAG